MTFPESLKIWRRENGFSQSQAAAFLDVPFRTYQQWEHGRQQPSQVGPVLKLLGMTPQKTGRAPGKRSKHANHN